MTEHKEEFEMEELDAQSTLILAIWEGRTSFVTNFVSSILFFVFAIWLMFLITSALGLV